MKFNKNYWIERYATMKGYNVVGHRSWTYDKYKTETEKFFDKITPYLPPIKTNKSLVLDFGCGIGRCIPLLEQHFDKYYGVDIVDEVIRRNTKRFPEHNFCTLRKDGVIPLNLKFNVIFSNVVLQHVVDDNVLRFYIQQFRTLIKDNGYLLLVENIEKKSRIFDYIKFRSPEEYIRIAGPYFKLEVMDKFISSKEKHAIFKGVIG